MAGFESSHDLTHVTPSGRARFLVGRLRFEHIDLSLDIDSALRVNWWILLLHDSWPLLGELSVERDEGTLGEPHVVFRIDRLRGAHWHTKGTVDALIELDAMIANALKCLP